ncbi:unnamed protein product [Gongylonema pulchrum]|uniref:S1 motif domain-containing protein n=1 Tax=Gongylonema pulchrum TaxID=637853 RepID=A0A183E6S1_9BILA|nr:unnamed protein product [Gongylonema pulchrum]
MVEVRIDYDEQSTVPKLGTWLVLRRTGNDNYEVERKCRKPVLPTRIYKNNVMLLHQELCMNFRTAAKYRPCIECNWMLTKYIERPGSEHVFDKIGHSNCDSFSDSNPLVKPFSSDSVSPAQTLTSKAERDLITGSVIVPISANTALENIKIFRGVVTLLSGSFAVIQPEGHIGFLKNNRSDNSLRDLKIGDWVAVAGVQRGKTIAYDIINLPSLISAEAPTKVKRGTVLVSCH